MVTTAKVLVAPSPVLAAVSWPMSVLINQKDTWTSTKKIVFFFGRPESYPGAHDDDGEGDVDLEDVESQGPIELELEEDDGVVSRLLGHLRPRPQGPVDHDVLCQVERLHA